MSKQTNIPRAEERLKPEPLQRTAVPGWGKEKSSAGVWSERYTAAEFRNTFRIGKISHRSKRVGGEIKGGCLRKSGGQNFESLTTKNESCNLQSGRDYMGLSRIACSSVTARSFLLGTTDVLDQVAHSVAGGCPGHWTMENSIPATISLDASRVFWL